LLSVTCDTQPGAEGGKREIEDRDTANLPIFRASARCDIVLTYTSPRESADVGGLFQ
jgi:hypothetical protein